MTRLAFVLVAVAGMAFVAGSFTTPPPVIYSQSNSRTAEGAASDDDVDAYGNEIASAVAEYSIDAAGDPYERHSPQTQLPRLRSPKT